MQKYLLFFLCLFMYLLTLAQTNPAVQTIPYAQDFNTLAHSANTYPAGWQGWVISTSPSGVFNTSAATADRNLIASSSASTNTGNVHNYNGKIGFLNTGSLDLSLVLAVDGTSKSNIQVAYDVMTIRNPYDGGTNTRVNELTIQYRIGNSGVFTNLTGIEYQNNTTTQTGTGVVTPQQAQSKIIVLPAACNNQPIIQIRWASRQVSGGGSRPSFAIDNIAVTENTALPTITSLSPANGSSGVPLVTTATATFNTNISKGTGNITVKRVADNMLAQTIPVSNTDVTVVNNTVTFNIASLAYNTAYYVEMDAGVFTDGVNNFNGITGSAIWNFTTTMAPPAGIVDNNYSFNTCGSTLPDGFTQYSVLGAQTWACTAFGRDPLNVPLGSAANGVQMNGFSGTNIINEDWLITPEFNLTATNIPLLRFWSRTRFNGRPLQLKVSTNYTGVGNPNNATWVDINGKFPPQTSDVWTISDNINLSAFKTTGVYIAFVYYSTNDDGARWTLDDIQITNSTTLPPASVTLSTNDIQFAYTAVGANTDKTFTVIGNDITDDITLTSTTADITLSTSSAGPFNASVVLPQATYNNVPATIYVRFSPIVTNLNQTGSITVNTASVSTLTVNVTGTSINPDNTLEVVNWNVEWFGSTTAGQGPSDKNVQQANVQTILQNIGADIYGLVEVVDESRLAAVVSNMPGYSYVICNWGSHTNTNSTTPSPLTGAQKQAFVYKTALFSNIVTAPLLSQGINTAADISNPAYNYFSSGRFPYMMTADVTLNGITQNVRFVLVHAKANTSPTATSYSRRKSSADTLYYTLNNLFPSDNIIVLGDFNDDLDQTITDGIMPPTSSYSAFINDDMRFSKPTLALSLAGKKSTVGFNDMIDHVITSNEMNINYMSNTAAALTDVASLVTNYGTTTTDHYPIFTRYSFSNTLPATFGNFMVANLARTVSLYWTTLQEANTKHFIIERSLDGINFVAIAQVYAAGNSSVEKKYNYLDELPKMGINYYRVRLVNEDGSFKTTDIKQVVFSSSIIVNVFPNPAKNTINIQTNTLQAKQAQIIDAAGRVVMHVNITQPITTVNISALLSGIYVVKISTPTGSINQKLVKQ